MTTDIENAIRIATPDDYQELMRICYLLWLDNGQHPWSEEKAKEFIWRGCHRDNAIVGVIGSSSDIKAVIYLEVMPVYYSDDVQLYEKFAFVRPDSRKSDFAKRLIYFARRCADETGIDLLIGIISDVKLEAKKRLYHRHLPEGGAWFCYHGKAKEGENVDARAA